MRFFFDTSVLIASFLEDHEHHPPSFTAFLKADKKNACCGAHSLAEVYSALTRLPGKHRISGEQAFLFLQEIRQRLEIISLTASEYFSTIEESASRGTWGGAIYDALLARCALKAGADAIYTWNVSHFQRLGPEILGRIKIP
jgi:predicted nucleic acid-binding protein